ncbi:MAG: hypothetical protein CM15mP111_4140 [Hyphomicrobiales bacterium]|nr:MAG: hypothetical protein CM15mP111_4140 [Hyphomicrobiales bacterium]
MIKKLKIKYFSFSIIYSDDNNSEGWGYLIEGFYMLPSWKFSSFCLIFGFQCLHEILFPKKKVPPSEKKLSTISNALSSKATQNPGGLMPFFDGGPIRWDDISTGFYHLFPFMRLIAFSSKKNPKFYCLYQKNASIGRMSILLTCPGVRLTIYNIYLRPDSIRRALRPKGQKNIDQV